MMIWVLEVACLGLEINLQAAAELRWIGNRVRDVQELYGNGAGDFVLF